MSVLIRHPYLFIFFFFNDTATTEIYTLSLHDALPISLNGGLSGMVRISNGSAGQNQGPAMATSSTKSSMADRKSTRLNSSHLVISYAVFCLKKKKQSDLRRR